MESYFEVLESWFDAKITIYLVVVSVTSEGLLGIFK